MSVASCSRERYGGATGVTMDLVDYVPALAVVFRCTIAWAAENGVCRVKCTRSYILWHCRDTWTHALEEIFFYVENMLD